MKRQPHAKRWSNQLVELGLCVLLAGCASPTPRDPALSRAPAAGDEASGATSQAVAGTGTREPILADYGFAARSSDGRLDIETTLNRLVEMGATTYEYLFYDQMYDWQDLPSFLKAAGERAIGTWVVLVAPHEYTHGFPPYEVDYVRWATEIGTLAAANPSLEALALSDFNTAVDQHPGFFSPDRICALAAAARKAAGRPLKFYAYDYYYLNDSIHKDTITDLATHGTCLDGVIFIYEDMQTIADRLIDIDLLRPEIEAIAGLRKGNWMVELRAASHHERVQGQASHTIDCSARPTSSVSFNYRDSEKVADDSFYGRRVAEVLQGNEVKWSAALGDIEDLGRIDVPLDPGGSQRITFRLRGHSLNATYVESFAQFYNVDLGDCASLGDDLRWEQQGLAPFSATRAIRYPRSTADMDLLVGIQLHRGSAPEPTPEYSRAALDRVRQAYCEGLVDGISSYGVRKSKSDVGASEREIVKDAFLSWHCS